MLDRSAHATFVPGDPGRESSLALWPSGWSPERVDLILPGGSATDPGRGGPPRRVDTQVSRVPLGDALDDLVGIGIDDDASPSLRAWAVVARDTLATIAAGRLRPAVSPHGYDVWEVGPLTDADRRRRRRLAAWLPPTAHCLPMSPGDDATVMGPDAAIDAFADALCDALVRTASAPVVAPHQPWSGPTPTEVADLARYLPAREAVSDVIVGLRLRFEDDAPCEIEVQLRSASDPTLVATAAELWGGRLRGFGPEAENDLLVALRRGARRWAPLARLLDSAHPSSIELDAEDASALFGAAARDLGEEGIEVMVPSDVIRTVETTAHLSSPSRFDQGGRLDLGSMCRLTWRASVGGVEIDGAELDALAAAKRPFVRWRGQWVVVDPAVAARLRHSEDVRAVDALTAALAGTALVGGEAAAVSVDARLEALVRRLRDASTERSSDEPEGLVATLRPYQRRGLAWLEEMAATGLGGVLADDMGLGKTIQLIALHLATATATGAPTLVICPASLVGNWERELTRFAPEVPTHRYHGPDRSLDDLVARSVVVTTYGIARRDAHDLDAIEWGLVVADEAQHIKNPHAATARAIRRIRSGARFALTGTPVENRLSDLWALTDWTTPGLLGTLESFNRSVALPIERDRDDETAERFRRMMAPFVLRRRKDDPLIAPELPPKTETDHPVTLTAEQAGLYRAVVDEMLGDIGAAEGMARRGLVFKLLTALKQVCNHPAHYLREPGPLAGRSAKMELFEELVEAIGDAGDSTLVFTQYVAMGDLLMTRLAELGRSARFLSGSSSLRDREAMVDDFQAGDFAVFVVSLKAGGTGLNLTRATHVIHYDRWWNPAVENQASDRAWRIGQDRPVQIHRLICDGTLEERIATMLAEKAELAESVFGSGEGWISELSDEDLAALVRIGSGH